MTGAGGALYTGAGRDKSAASAELDSKAAEKSAIYDTLTPAQKDRLKEILSKEPAPEKDKAPPKDAKDAALGMGFTPRQMLWRVEIPLAMPVIIAGIRIATVSTIGLVTIAALIGRGGFGQFILEGLDELFWTPLLLGVVLSVAFAVAADVLLIGAGRLISPWTRAASLRIVGT